MTAGTSHVTRELKVSAVTGTIGAELSGVDLAGELSDETVAEIRAGAPRESCRVLPGSIPRLRAPSRLRPPARDPDARPPDDRVSARHAADGGGRLRQGGPGRRLAHRRDLPRPAGELHMLARRRDPRGRWRHDVGQHGERVRDAHAGAARARRHVCGSSTPTRRAMCVSTADVRTPRGSRAGSSSCRRSTGPSTPP